MQEVLHNATYGVMKYVLTDADKLELAQIEADARDVKDRRKRFFSKLRQRAYRERHK